MPRKYKRISTRGLTYDGSTMTQAVNAVLNETMPLATTAKEFKIPRNTLRRNLGGPSKNMGRPTVFKPEQETCLRDRIIFLAERGFPLTITDVQALAYHYAYKLHRRKKLAHIPVTWINVQKASYE
jgi:hypothetical protein